MGCIATPVYNFFATGALQRVRYLCRAAFIFIVFAD